jgi:hypothetical protein
MLATQLRQDKPSDDGGGNDAAQGIKAKLGEAGKAGKEQGAEAADGGQDAEPDGRPEALAPAGQPGLSGLHEVVDGVIDRLADQRRAETDGDAEDAAVGQADRNDAAQRAGNDRQQTEPEQPEGAVDEEQHGDDGDRADQRQAADFVLDRRPRIDREQAGAGELELGVGTPAASVLAANSLRRRLIAASWPSVSEPRACVWTSSIARSPSREAQTPLRLLGWAPAFRPEAFRSVRRSGRAPASA